MKKVLLAAMCAMAMAGFATGAAAASLRDVEQAMAATTTMSADFTQTAANGGVATGQMLLKRPGKIRFDYEGGTPYLVVADGRNLSFVDYQVAQVSQWPIRSTPLGVLLDPQADLARLAKVIPAEKSPVAGTVAVHAEDPKKPELGSILFLLVPDKDAPGGLRLSGWRVTDAQGNLTVVSLSNVRFNVAISDAKFRFDDPRRRGNVPGRVG